MINLTHRSLQPELLDADNIPFADIKQNMRELNIVNTRLGGHHITISAIKKILAKHNKTEITICEIGCGGGDNLAVIAKWCVANRINVRLTGIDIKHECVEFAKQQYPDLHATWIVSDYKMAELTHKPTIIFSSLFCHHFKDEEIVSMLSWMNKNCSSAFFINDLHRHVIAYHLIKWITRFFSRSYLVKNDAPLSVARGFKKAEWQALLKRAGLDQCSIQWKWAFRHLLICHK